MKIVIAPDSFKGSCSTFEVADAIERGIKKAVTGAETVKVPVADGGEGTVDALVQAAEGQYREAEVIGPLGEKINAKFGIINGDTAVIEMASASGLPLVDAEKLNPMITTTYGTGQLIKAAMDSGCQKILIGIGGSATNDGGIGMAQALGVSFRDEAGQELGFGGAELVRLNEIDVSGIDKRLSGTEVIIISDVDNPLCGERGASHVYGPQKGATPEMVKKLDAYLSHYASVILTQLKKDILEVPGAGASGGLGGGLIVFCDAILHPGIEKVLDESGAEEAIRNADLVITGEGKIDNQSIYGKVPVGVAKRAVKYQVPVIAIVGSVGEGAAAAYDCGIDAIVDIINKPMTLQEAIENSAELIENAAENAIRLFNAKK